jgi:hypothetical protein
MDHITTRLTKTDDGKFFFLNLFAHHLDKSIPQTDIQKRTELQTVEKVINSFAGEHLYLTTRAGSIDLGVVHRAKVSTWGEGDIPSSITGTLILHVNEVTTYLYNRTLKINSVLIPTGAEHITPIVYLNEYLNKGINYDLTALFSMNAHTDASTNKD